MHQFADIVLPVAVRQVFTYAIPKEYLGEVKAGMRVWIPFRNHFKIGMVVRTHSKKPEFETRSIKKVLDSSPIMSKELMRLTDWIHRFYYCGWGEVVQAALPVGLNFYSETYLKCSGKYIPSDLSKEEKEMLEEIEQKGEYLYKNARERWNADKYSVALQSLIKQGIVIKWEKPELKVQPSTEKRWNWAQGVDETAVRKKLESFSEKEKEYKWVRALEKLLHSGLPKFQAELKKLELIDYYTLNRIQEEGLIKQDEEEYSEQFWPAGMEFDPESLHELNEEQQGAYESILDKIIENRYASFLLYGITGSGKTEVYIHALKKVLDSGKGGVVLVPEIGLTPQIINRFYRIFGDQIAVIHSRLSDKERFEAWRALRSGEKRIVIGARSAIFAPVQNIGLIVIDEEHDMSYKQEDPAPRYHARDVAIMRAKFNEAVVIMGSATPSLQSLQGVRNNKHDLLSLSSRPNNAKLPDVTVIDLRQYRSAMKGPLAIPLHEAVIKALRNNEQVILLHNRRGYSSFLQCHNCGEIPQCPNCSVSLTYHKFRNQIRCHYCGYSQKSYSRCNSCGAEEMDPVGTGTQKLEEQLGALYGESEVLRMDYDTTSGKNSHRRILEKFGRKEARILIGTQIVGKGLDFPDVTVVGVINADTELAFPSFRSSERLYQLLSQVAGRSGRAFKEGKVFFQTWQPDHKAIQAAKDHDYRSFAKVELAYRSALQYPPFSRLVRFTFKGNNEQKVRLTAEQFTLAMSEITDAGTVLGPAPAVINRMQKVYFWESLMKVNTGKDAKSIELLLDKIFERFDFKKKPEGAVSVRINVNVDALE